MPAMIEDHYNAYPYPERNPQDERKRLITGSPSNPFEIDHHVFGGRRDWSKTIKILVAGGGSGDGLIQIAQGLTDANRPYEIVYIDLSTSTRKIAEERAEIRGLRNITFITGSLLDAADYGEFDYIDCCGVLHHLEDTQAGFTALSNALTDGGGLGFMVYAPYGRSGVYPLQEAFGALSEGMTPEERLKFGQTAFGRVPDTHPFKRNELLGDHNDGPAGFYDLLLHNQDRATSVKELNGYLTEADLELSSFAQPALYRLSDFLPEGFELPEGLSNVDQMHLAEKLRGTLKTHVGYANKIGQSKPINLNDHSLIPHFIGADPRQAAQVILKTGVLQIHLDGQKIGLTMPPVAAKLMGVIDGQRCLADIVKLSGMDRIAFSSIWAQLSALLCDYGLLLYSDLGKN
ncbi:class I SAM-dependent methyltransferase [Amylibacter sp. SFDW26]|uniref:class I SAM-dependent methyltransferase n=1 Tax=Amylibacter sp. SFDW26 TaxID=2652722 RepID=UPI0012620DDB|nr:class I SAM-dependent methyltransferase [Amylibacter sp. SFDW26]KAB7615707.1 class I SAM-dependent methyltransferase [Amylibacter sp. SFDW26]